MFRLSLKSLMTVALLVIATLFIVVPTPAAAQQDFGDCSVYLSGNTWSSSVSTTWEECLYLIASYAVEHDMAEAYAVWGLNAVWVDGRGDVYWSAVSSLSNIPWERLTWTYWGSLVEFIESLPLPDNSQPVKGGTVNNNNSVNNNVNSDVVPLTFEEAHELVVEDINDFWVEVYDQVGADYYRPDVILTDEARFSTACGDVSDEVGPLYCSYDHTIYLPENFMRFAFEEIGDFAIAVIIAHEWGHAIQGQTGFLNSPTTNVELQADCLAGAYSEYISTRSVRLILEEGDIEEGMIQMYVVGDTTAGPLRAWYDMGAHGTPEQRVESFTKGLTEGVAAC